MFSLLAEMDPFQWKPVAGRPPSRGRLGYSLRFWESVEVTNQAMACLGRKRKVLLQDDTSALPCMYLLAMARSGNALPGTRLFLPNRDQSGMLESITSHGDDVGRHSRIS
jgi:hypothetical protein